MTPLRVALIRHGQTAANVARVMDTLPPGAPLNETGRWQAAQLAERLADEPVTAVYASTAIRSQQTAEHLAARHGLPVTVLDGLREVYLGSLEGRRGDGPHAEYLEICAKWAAGDLGIGLRGGESAAQVLERFGGAIEQIRARHPAGLVLVVSHGGAIRLAAMRMASNITSEMQTDGVLPNTGQVLLEATPLDELGPGWRCLGWSAASQDPWNVALDR